MSVRSRDVVPGLKTQYGLDEFDTSNPDVMDILLYAALLSLLVSRELLDLVTCERFDDTPTQTQKTPCEILVYTGGEYVCLTYQKF